MGRYSMPCPQPVKVQAEPWHAQDGKNRRALCARAQTGGRTGANLVDEMIVLPKTSRTLLRQVDPRQPDPRNNRAR